MSQPSREANVPEMEKMVGRPTISIVVPVYQAQDYLNECINSLLAQEFQDFELILIDDGSTDASAEMCDSFVQKDARVRVFHQKNAGVSAARNRGIAQARGEYIAFVDADDWVERSFLSNLYATIGDAQIVLCGVDDGEEYRPPMETFRFQKMATMPSRYAKLVYTNYAINKLYRRDLLLPVGPRFVESMKRGEDAMFIASCLTRCEFVAVCPKILYHYRENPKSATHYFYEGVCRDEDALWHAQSVLFSPNQMSQKERNCYNRWLYGRIISVLRYIARYAPRSNVRRKYVRDFLADDDRMFRFTHLPSGIAGRSILYAALAARGWYGMLGTCLKWLG